MDIDFPPYAERFRKAREASGLDPKDVAEYLNLNTAWCYDLESCDDEIGMNVSLEVIRRACDLFKSRVWDLIAPEPTTQPPPPLGLFQLRDQVCSYVNQHKLDPNTFAERSGWDIAVIKSDTPAETWNLECLKHLAALVGVDWLKLVSSGFADRV